jgi:hypothetical protein
MLRLGPPETLAREFDAVAHILRPAVDVGYGDLELADFKYWVLDGTMQLWVGGGYAAVTEVINYPRSRSVLVHLIGGNLESILEANGALDQFAKAMKAKHIEIIGRKGWTKVLRGRGYREAAVHLVKEV